MRTLIIALAATVLLSACSTEKYGTEVAADAPLVKVKDVILSPAYSGRTVTMKGIIITQCMTNGCWLFLNDGTGQIYVDMAPRGFAVPPRTGKKATVTGLVAEDENGIRLIAYGVEVS